MKVLNFQERNEFLDEVVKACTIDGDYQPALLDVVFRLTVLKYFADYDYRSEPQSEWPRIAYESFNFKIDKAGCDTSAFWDQYDSLEKAVHEQIDRSHKEWLVLGLCGKLNEIIEKPDPISDFVEYSTIQKSKSTMMVCSGIEAQNYEKTVNLVKEQVQKLKDGDITESEISNAKIAFINSLNSLNDEIGRISDFYFSQSISKNKSDLDQIKNMINKSTKEDIVEAVKNIELDTIYFLSK